MRYLVVSLMVAGSLFCSSSQPKNYVEIPHAKDCRTYWYLTDCGGN